MGLAHHGRRLLVPDAASTGNTAFEAVSGELLRFTVKYTWSSGFQVNSEVVIRKLRVRMRAPRQQGDVE